MSPDERQVHCPNVRMSEWQKSICTTFAGMSWRKHWVEERADKSIRERNVHTADLTFPLKSWFGIQLNEIDFNWFFQLFMAWLQQKRELCEVSQLSSRSSLMMKFAVGPLSPPLKLSLMLMEWVLLNTFWVKTKWHFTWDRGSAPWVRGEARV